MPSDSGKDSKVNLRPFDDYLSEKLRDREYAAAYVETALEEGEVEEFLCALRKVGGAQGKDQPALPPLDDLLRALGLRITVTRDGLPSQQQREPSPAAVLHA